MTLYQQFDAALRTTNSITEGDALHCRGIMERVRGYSDLKHFAFFKSLLALPDVHDVLVLGVYFGRDIAFMREALNAMARADVRIVGVDKFSDTPCADWPAANRQMGWTQSGFGLPPVLALAKRNCGAETDGPVILIESDDAKFLNETDRKFDVVYLDTAHDETTVTRQIRQAQRLVRPGGVICGDDYANGGPHGTWGVKTAVEKGFSAVTIFDHWLWASGVELIRT